MADTLTERAVIQRGVNLVTDTTAETKSAVADMSGFDEVTFVVELEDVDAAAVLTFTVKENTANSTTSPTPTAVTLTDIPVNSVTGVITNGALVLTESTANLDQKTVIITVNHSVLTKRYCFLSITATVESYEVNSITIIKSRPKSLPVTQGSNVVAAAQAAA
jgi:aconitase B